MGSSPELVRQFVQRALQRKKPDGLAGRAHPAGRGDVAAEDTAWRVL